MARRICTWWLGAISALVLAACTVDDRSPVIVEPSSGSRGTEQGGSSGTPAENPSGAPEGAGAAASTANGVSASAGDSPALSAANAADTSGTSGPSGKLVANVDHFDFGGLEVGVVSGSFSWLISNEGDVSTSALSLRSDDLDPFQARSTCPASLPAGSSCNVEVSFAPTYDGTVARNLQFGQSGQMLSLALTGIGRYRLNVQRVGRGSVTDASNGLTCTGDTCTGLFDHAMLELSARTQNGSGSFFTGWSVAECAAKDDCSLDLDASRSITATFQEQSSNLIFVTSSNYPSNFGGLAALDAECNRVASAAGINGAAGTDFIAAVSSSSASLRQRLGTARGWVRRDGLPVADTLDAIFGRFQMMYPAWLTEHGAPSTDLVMTGTEQTGAVAPQNCNDWTSLDPAVSYRGGRPDGGPRAWMGSTTLSCGGQRTALYCMGTRLSTPVTLVPTAGKRIWLTTDEYAPGTMTPDAFCESHRPAGVARAVAFVAYTTQQAAAVLDLNALYVRPDGALVGSGSDIAKMKLLAGPWLTNDGTNDSASALVWAGAATPADLADPMQNCDDWTGLGVDYGGRLGDGDSSSERFFFSNTATGCKSAATLRCIEP
jgi:hypothetical protein